VDRGAFENAALAAGDAAERNRSRNRSLCASLDLPDENQIWLDGSLQVDARVSEKNRLLVLSAEALYQLGLRSQVEK
jgi:hypothetical protein